MHHYTCLARFASVTVNLGPTFLSGALAANAGAVMDEPSCPLVQVWPLSAVWAPV